MALSSWLAEPVTSERLIELTRLYARAGKGELNVPGVGPGDFTAVAEALPETEEGAKVLYRLARAYGISPAEVSFHGMRLSEYPVLHEVQGEWWTADNKVAGEGLQNVRGYSPASVHNALVRGLLRPWDCPPEQLAAICAGLQDGSQGYLPYLSTRYEFMALFARAAELGHPVALSEYETLTGDGSTDEAVLSAKLSRALDIKPTARADRAFAVYERNRASPNLEDMVANALSPTAIAAERGDRDWHLQLLEIWRAGMAQGAFSKESFARYVRMMPHALQSDPAVMAALARACLAVKRSEWRPTSERLSLSGTLLKEHPPFIDALARASRTDSVVQGPVDRTLPPLGTERFTTRDEVLVGLRNADARLLRMDDATAAILGEVLSSLPLLSTELSSLPASAQFAEVYARGLEILPFASREGAALRERVGRLYFQRHWSTAELGTDGPSALMRLARAAQLDPRRLTFSETGAVSGDSAPVGSHPTVLSQMEAAQQLRSEKLQSALGALDPIKIRSAEEDVEALSSVLRGGLRAASFDEALREAIRARLDNRLSPVDLRLTPDRQAVLVKEWMGSFVNPAAGAVLVAVMTKIPSETLVKAMREKGLGERETAAWEIALSALQSAHGRGLEYLTEPMLAASQTPDFSSMLARAPLATGAVTEPLLNEVFECHADDPVNVASAILARGMWAPENSGVRDETVRFVQKLVEAERLPAAYLQSTAILAKLFHPEFDARFAEQWIEQERFRDPEKVIRALVSRALAESDTSPTRTEIATLLNREIEEGRIPASVVRQLSSAAELIEPVSAESLKRAVEQYNDATASMRIGALEELLRAMKSYSALSDPGALIESVLGQLYKADLRESLPLGRVEALAEPVPAGHARVGALTLPMHDDPHRDFSAVPSLEETQLVENRTTRELLERVARTFVTGDAGWLEGQPGTAKTSMIAYLAAKMGWPLEQIVGHEKMSKNDLVGRLVDGREIWTSTDLQALNEGELRRAGYDFGINGRETPRQQLIEKILAAQVNPHYQYGPLARALLEGNALAIEEALAIRPGVISVFNNLLDDNKSLLIEENGNEVLRPHKNFRLFFTTNSAELDGRFGRSVATGRRVVHLPTYPYTTEDLSEIVLTKFPKLSPEVVSDIIAAHLAMVEMANLQRFEEDGVSFSNRDILAASKRIAYFLDPSRGELPEDRSRIVARELDQVYRGGLVSSLDRDTVERELQAIVPVANRNFYGGLQLTQTPEEIRIGDIAINKINSAHALVPSPDADLEQTPEALEILYRFLSAVFFKENPLFVGEAGGGKTATMRWAARLRQQPFLTQLMTSDTSARQIIGGFNASGFQLGAILNLSELQGLYLADEYLNLSPAVQVRLNSATDSNRSITLSEDRGQKVSLGANFILAAAANPPSERYPGSQQQSSAERSRYRRIYVPVKSESEKRLILQKFADRSKLPPWTVDALMTFDAWASAEFSKLEDPPELSFSEPLRVLKNMTTNKTVFGETDEEAFVNAVKLSYFKSPDRQFNTGIFERASAIVAGLT